MSGATRRAAKFPLRLDQMTDPRKATGKPATVGPSLRAAAAVPVTPRPVLRPQSPVAHAAAVAAQRATPTGIGLDSAGVRARMVDRLRAQGVGHVAVLEAMGFVARHQFVDAALVTQAYEDTSLPIGHGQTISKPSVVARMVDLLLAGENARATGQLKRVLEIGTGCGYQAAVLSRLARQVYSVERVKALHDKARGLLAPLGLGNIRLIYGDGMLGHPPNAPYDGIIAAAGGDALPEAWTDQLAIGGRIVAPVQDGQRQVIVVVDRTERGLQRSVHEVVQFVPLRSGLVR